MSPGFPDNLQRRHRHTVFVSLPVHMSVTTDFKLTHFRQSVNYRNTHAMKTTRYFIRIVGEFTSGVQFSHNHFRRRDFFRFVHSYRDTATVIFHNHAVIHSDFYQNSIAISGRSLINAVIHNFIYQMMQTVFTGRTNVHRRPSAHGFQTLENFNAISIIFVRHKLFTTPLRLFLYF